MSAFDRSFTLPWEVIERQKDDVPPLGRIVGTDDPSTDQLRAALAEHPYPMLVAQALVDRGRRERRSAPATTGYPPRVFISYRWESPAHKRLVMQLAERIGAAGLTVDLDQIRLADDLDPHDPSIADFVARIVDADVAVVVASRSYTDDANRTWLFEERRLIAREAALGRLRPVVLVPDGVEVPDELRTFPAVPLVGDEAGIGDALAEIDAIVGRAARPRVRPSTLRRMVREVEPSLREGRPVRAMLQLLYHPTTLPTVEAQILLADAAAAIGLRPVAGALARHVSRTARRRLVASPARLVIGALQAALGDDRSSLGTFLALREHVQIRSLVDAEIADRLTALDQLDAAVNWYLHAVDDRVRRGGLHATDVTLLLSAGSLLLQHDRPWGALELMRLAHELDPTPLRSRLVAACRARAASADVVELPDGRRIDAADAMPSITCGSCGAAYLGHAPAICSRCAARPIGDESVCRTCRDGALVVLSPAVACVHCGQEALGRTEHRDLASVVVADGGDEADNAQVDALATDGRMIEFGLVIDVADGLDYWRARGFEWAVGDAFTIPPFVEFRMLVNPPVPIPRRDGPQRHLWIPDLGRPTTAFRDGEAGDPPGHPSTVTISGTMTAADEEHAMQMLSLASYRLWSEMTCEPGMAVTLDGATHHIHHGLLP